MKRLSITSNDSVLITNPTNILYLTGFVGVERRDAYVLVTKNKTYLFTTSLYLEAAQKLNVTVIEISREKPIEQELSKLVKTVAFEENDLRNLQAYLSARMLQNDLGYERLLSYLPSPPPERSLAALYKHLIPEWHYEKTIEDGKTVWVKKFPKIMVNGQGSEQVIKVFPNGTM